VRYVFCFVTLMAAAVVLQTAVIPAWVPPVMRPDITLLIGITALAFTPREFALVLIFGLGIEADLFGSARFGLLTLCYLLSAGIVLWAAWRELTRGDLLAPWIAGVLATALAHSLYIVIGRLCGLDLTFAAGATTLTSLLLASLVWGLPVAWLAGKWMFMLGVLSPPVREKWIAEARIAAARRGKALRA
jgi:hypothetical protein